LGLYKQDKRINERKADGKDLYVNTFDKRGNLVKTVFEKNKNHTYVTQEYAYDATNRMVKGTNEEGEQSHYVFNGFGDLVANEWITAKNAYGYHGVGLYLDPSEQVNGVVFCDRHQNTTGQGHINPTGNGHTTGGTTGATMPKIDNKKFAVIHKDYALDFTKPLKNVIMETESGDGGVTYRSVYGLEKVETVIYGIENGAGSVMQYAYNGGISGEPAEGGTPVVKLYSHQDRLGTADYLTDNVAGKAASYVSYDGWGALTAKAVLKLGARELDLVNDYTGHPYDMVLGAYYAKARMYDAENQ